MTIFRKASVAAAVALVPVGLALTAETANQDESSTTVEVAESVRTFADQFATAFTPGAVESLDASGADEVVFTPAPKITEVAGE